MTPEDVDDLFRPIASVRTRKMFGGLGVYHEGLMFAVVAFGELFMKVDDETEATFAAAGSEPFVYESATKSITMRYWRLPAEAYDDEEVLADFTGLAFDAARRAGPPKKRRAKSHRAPSRGAQTSDGKPRKGSP